MSVDRILIRCCCYRLAPALRILLFVISCATTAHAQERGLPFIRNYTPKEYSGAPQVWTTVQDDRDVLYMGIDHAVLEYDGVKWRQIPVPSNVYSLAIGDAGVLYAGCIADLGIVDFSGFEPRFRSLLPLLNTTKKIGNIWDIKFLNHEAYFLSSDAIYVYNQNDSSIRTYRADTTGSFVGCFVSAGEYHVRHSGSGLLAISREKLQRVAGGHVFAARSEFSYCNIPLTGNDFLIGTRFEGIYKYRPGSKSIKTPFTISGGNAEETALYSGASYSDRYKIIGTLSKGALLIDTTGQVLTTYNEASALNNNSIYRITIDKSKNIWLPTDAGVSKTQTGLDLSIWNKAAGINGSISGIKRYDGQLYLAGSQYVYRMTSTGAIEKMDNLPVGQHWAIEQFTDGSKSQLLLGSFSGVYQLEGTRNTKLFSGRHAFFVHQSKVDPKRLYTSDIPHLVSLRFENGKWITEGRWNGVQSRWRSIVEEDDGTIWLGTYNEGIVRIKPNLTDITNPTEIKIYGLADGLPSIENCRPFIYDSLVLAGTAKGLYYLNRITNRFEPYDRLDARYKTLTQPVLFFQQNTSGTIVTAGGENITGDVALLEKGKSWNMKPFKRLPEIAEMGTVTVEEDGVIWIGCSEGLIKYDPRFDDRNYDQEFSALIRRVASGDSVLYHGTRVTGKVRLPYSMNNVQFEFAAPFFDEEENTRYAFRLVGYDKDWSSWSRITSKEYTNLEGGHYAFEVKALNLYGKESSLASFSFDIELPLYQRWWAYLIYLLIAGAITTLVVERRTKILRERNQMLEHKVTERTSELSEANRALRKREEELRLNMEQLSKTLQELSSTQQQLIEAEKIASLGQLTSGLAHEMNNPLNYISGGLQGIKSVVAEMMQSGSQLSPETLLQLEEIKELMLTMETGVSKSAKIIKSLRIFSSTDADAATDSTFNIIKSIRDCISILQIKIQQANVQVSVPEGVVEVQGNHNLISHALMNILDNAIDALLPITTERTILILVEQTANDVRVHIRDSGVGIRDEIKNQIMNPFFSTKEVGKGTGLGLSISYSIIRKHQGDLTFTSTVAKGTEFTIRLPKPRSARNK